MNGTIQILHWNDVRLHISNNNTHVLILAHNVSLPAKAHLYSSAPGSKQELSASKNHDKHKEWERQMIRVRGRCPQTESGRWGADREVYYYASGAQDVYCRSEAMRQKAND